MPDATEDGVKQIVLGLASSMNKDFSAASSGAILKELQKQGKGGWDGGKISQLEQRMKLESTPIDLACLSRIDSSDFRTSTSFPKFDERRVYKIPNKGVSRWTAQEARTLQRHLALVQVRGKNAGKRVMLATKTYAYLYGNTGLYVDTQAAAGDYSGKSFPEIGVEEIPMDAIHVSCRSFAFTMVHRQPQPALTIPATVSPHSSRKQRCSSRIRPASSNTVMAEQATRG